MRKDEIEARIIRLEEEMRTLKADHRDGVDAILSAMQKMQDAALDARITDLRERIVEGYQTIFLDMMLKNAGQNLDARCLDPCVRDRRKECCEFLTARLRVAAQKHQDPEIVLPKNRETISDRALVKKAPFLAEGPCSTCFSAYLHEKEQIMTAIDRFKGGMGVPPKKRPGIFLSDLPDDLAISALVGPLSHAHRFAMLKALSRGSMSFKELGSLTGSKGGHLVYHITILTDAGFVTKADGGKRYAITDRGLGVVDLVRNLYAPHPQA